MLRVLPLVSLGLLLSTTAPGQSTSTPVMGARVPCTNGAAAGFVCQGVDLLSFLPISEIGGATVSVNGVQRSVSLNDIWGWVDPLTGSEYALVGRTDGTAFVDVTDPVNPRYLGMLPSHEIVAGVAAGGPRTVAGTSELRAARDDDHGQFAAKSLDMLHDEPEAVSPWRDVKVYENHVLVVADASPNHGVQFFDLTQLRDVQGAPVTFGETAHYDGIGSAHNIVVNEQTGYAFSVGSSGGTHDACGGGLHMIDVSDPTAPEFAGCFADLTTGRANTGYTHDAQCVVYRGPDEAFVGREICIGANETAISIADVTDKMAPVAVSTASYPNASYIHQGWLTEDHRFFLQDDELDETRFGVPTRTIVWDVQDLEDPQVLTVYEGETMSIDHNLYVVGNLVFQANYKSGLRILDITDPTAPVEIAYFDTYPDADNRGFEGAWSNYPFFPSGVVIVSSMREGLFVLDPLVAPVVRPTKLRLASVYPNPFVSTATVMLKLGAAAPVSVAVYDLLGRQVAVLHDGRLETGAHRIEFDASGLSSGTYFIRAESADGSDMRAVTLVR